MFFRSITVVEASASHAACGRFSARRAGRMRLHWYATAPFVPEPEREGDWPKKIGGALQALRARGGRPGPVVLTLPAHLLLTRFFATPRVGPAERDKIVRFEAEQSMPYSLKDMVWGGTVVGETVGGYDVMICAAKLEAVEPLCAAVEACGFTPVCLLPSPLATLAAAGLARSAADPGTIVVNVGTRSCTLLMREKNRNHLRSFPVGGIGLTAQVARRDDGDPAAAGDLKLADSERVAPEQTSAFLAKRLAQEIARSALFFQSQFSATAPVRILLAGDCCRLPDLGGRLALQLKLPVGRLELSGLVDAGADAGPELNPDVGSDLCDLIGAAAAHVAGTGRVIDLLPARLAVRAVRKRRQPWLAAAAAVGVAALAPPVIHYGAVIAALQGRSLAVGQELVPLRAREVRRHANREKLGKVEREVATLQGILDRRTMWTSLLADLQQRLDEVEDVWFDRLQIAPSAMGSRRAPPDPPSPLRFTVSGRMLDRANPQAKVSDATFQRVKVLLESIADSPFIAAVESEGFDNTQAGVLRFTFVFTPEPSPIFD